MQTPQQLPANQKYEMISSNLFIVQTPQVILVYTKASELLLQLSGNLSARELQ